MLPPAPSTDTDHRPALSSQKHSPALPLPRQFAPYPKFPAFCYTTPRPENSSGPIFLPSSTRAPAESYARSPSTSKTSTPPSKSYFRPECSLRQCPAQSPHPHPHYPRQHPPDPPHANSEPPQSLSL